MAKNLLEGRGKLFAAVLTGLAITGIAVPAAQAWLGTAPTVYPHNWLEVNDGPRRALVVGESYWTGSGGFILNDNGEDMDLALRTNCSGIGYTAIEYNCKTTVQDLDNIAQICPSGSSLVATQGNLQAITVINWGNPFDPCNFD